MYTNDGGDGETLNNKTSDIKRFWFTHMQTDTDTCGVLHFGCFTLFDW